MNAMVPEFRELLDKALSTKDPEELKTLAKLARKASTHYEILAEKLEEKITKSTHI